MRRPSMLALGLFAAAGPVSTDMYVSALPQVQQALHSSAGVTQLTATACIVGIAAGMTASGPLSDSRGRRPPPGSAR